jgi:hypothetical protein
MQLEMKWEGKWDKAPDELTGLIDVSVKKRMNAAMEAVRKEAFELLSHLGTGRRYRVPGTKNTYYTASSPGQPPAVATNDLKNSLKDMEAINVSDDGTVGEVGTTIDYGAMLQFGTRNILPRPWLDVAFLNKLAEIEAIFSQDWMQ